MRELRYSKAYACSNSDLDEVLFYDVIFLTQNRDLSSEIFWSVLPICVRAYLVPVNKKN